ncbi:MAG: TSUP family transporter [Clostridia bacterium]|nr:TSUP family transporter [Clostridia bacterium]
MEYFWYIIASLGAGIGTGLAGLSAATVMVPILIVLCPSFSGEFGVYQATCIALASDILGSAVTTFVYIKNKKINLKMGWIMLLCILVMCSVGSYVAYLAGNVVLGNFTLFLTLCIGIRFLIKPDSQKKGGVVKELKMGIKEIIISVFFGLTIGFGTGFVGTGGGMMMLAVFTMFLGMELKTAVGTSTFIMTFTALIGSVSHILISPSILIEKWDVMLICIVVATISSLVSAKFANKVDNKTVGVVTGAVLTILGALMLLLNYWDKIAQVEFLHKTIICFGKLTLFLAVSAIILILVRFTIKKLPSFVFRKLLHLAAFSSIIIMIYASDYWLASALTSLIFALIIYPILVILEKHFLWFSHLFVQKSKGEITRSLLSLFGMAGVLITIAWGILDFKWVAITSILMWGFGDASAAIVGKSIGKHHFKNKFINDKKTLEGSISMFIVCVFVGIFAMIFSSKFNIVSIIIMIIPSALVSTFVELVSPSELDTVTVPMSCMMVLSFMSLLF